MLKLILRSLLKIPSLRRRAEAAMRQIVPEAHHFTCGFCKKPIHPWEDKCPFCGQGINWPKELKDKYPEPDEYSRTVERDTSYARWLKTTGKQQM